MICSRSQVSEEKAKEMEKKKVIIVGAGAAGLAAAQRLLEGGETDFLVVEATERVGGRVRSVPMGDSGLKTEHGAQWIDGHKGNVVYDLAKKWGLLEFKNGIDPEDDRSLSEFHRVVHLLRDWESMRRANYC